MKNTSHLKALEIRLSHEREYLSQSKTDMERRMRQVWIDGITKEIEDEKKFLGIGVEDTANDMTDEELLIELGI